MLSKGRLYIIQFLIVGFVLVSLFAEAQDLRIEKISSFKFPIGEIWLPKEDEEQPDSLKRVPIVVCIMSNDRIAAMTKSLGIMVFSPSGKIISKYVTPTNTIPVKFVNEDELLTFSVSIRKFMFWSISEQKRIKTLQLSYEYLTFYADYVEDEDQIIIYTRSIDAPNKSVYLARTFYSGDDLSKLGQPIATFYPPDNDSESFVVFNALGKATKDRRVLILQHYDSKLYEYDIDGELNFIYEPIEDFNSDFDKYDPETDKRLDMWSEPWDNFSYLNLIQDSIFIATRNQNSPHGFIDIWDISHRKYLGKIDIGKRYLFGVMDNELWIIDSLDSKYFFVGKYKLTYPMDTTKNISQYSITEPFNGKKVNLATCLPKYEDTLIILNSKPHDCYSLSYYYSEYYLKYTRPYPCVVIFTSRYPEALISLKNSSVAWDVYSILNTDLSLKKELPYGMVINKRGDIVRELKRGGSFP